MKQSIESKVLKASIRLLVVFAFSGIFFGMVFQSRVVFFEGLYNGLSIIISAVILKVTEFIHKKDDALFPFGKEGIIPLVVVFQYLVLIVMLFSMLADAIGLIRSGGMQSEFLPILIYMVFSTALQMAYLGKLKRVEGDSAILHTEVQQWRVSFRQSLFVLSGYVIGFIVSQLGFIGIAPYVDPIVLILFVISSFIAIFDDVKNAFIELIGMNNVSEKAYQRIENRINAIARQHSIRDYVIRMRRVGGQLVLEIDFLVDHAFENKTVKDQDGIREEIYRFIHEKNLNLWLNITFTTELRWIQ